MVTKDTLYSFYMKILDTLAGDPKRIRKIFMWLVTAHTPMTLAELRVVSAFDPDLHTSRASMQDDLALGDFGAYLKACGALVRIVGASQTAHLVHQSVREFFLDANHPFGFNQVDEEEYISTACLIFLSFKDLANSPAGVDSGDEYEDPRLQNECPFLRYAATSPTTLRRRWTALTHYGTDWSPGRTQTTSTLVFEYSGTEKEGANSRETQHPCTSYATRARDGCLQEHSPRKSL